MSQLVTRRKKLDEASCKGSSFFDGAFTGVQFQLTNYSQQLLVLELKMFLDEKLDEATKGVVPSTLRAFTGVQFD